MTVPLLVFFVVAALAVLSAIGLIVRKNPIHAALFLVVNLFCVAVLYLQLQAEFLAAAQVIIYAGAIMVLFLFALMVLVPGREEMGPDPRRAQRMLAFPLGAILLIEVGLMVRAALRSGGTAEAPKAAPPGGVEAIGRMLFTDYLFPFEVTSILLLAAIVGAMVLAKRKVQ